MSNVGRCSSGFWREVMRWSPGRFTAQTLMKDAEINIRLHRAAKHEIRTYFTVSRGLMWLTSIDGILSPILSNHSGRPDIRSVITNHPTAVFPQRIKSRSHSSSVNKLCPPHKSTSAGNEAEYLACQCTGVEPYRQDEWVDEVMRCGGRVVPAAVRMVMEDEENCIISG